MKITRQLTEETILQELGKRLTTVRLNRNLTQAEVAANAGVSKRTVERLEAGQSAQLGSFVRVCRALGLIDQWELLIPEGPPSPIAQLKLQGKAPQRARRKNTTAPPSRKWTWGDSA